MNSVLAVDHIYIHLTHVIRDRRPEPQSKRMKKTDCHLLAIWCTLRWWRTSNAGKAEFGNEMVISAGTNQSPTA